MKKRYLINKHNSTVCGYPGRDFDWSKFDWEGGAAYISIFDRKILFSIPPFTDDCLIEPHCQYLHVVYDWVEHGTVYRVRPNPSMRAGKLYHGHQIKEQRAVQIDRKWYWELEFK